MAGAAADPGEQASLPASIRVGAAELAVWPERQTIGAMSAPMMANAIFDDWERYHSTLIEAAMTAERDARFRGTYYRSSCGTKVRSLPQWNAPAASLVHARALMLAHQVLSRKPVFADDTWASIYRDGDYCMPHSHLRSTVSVVYMLDPGDADRDDVHAGALCFADARIPACCPHEPGRVTRLVMPTMTPGTMLIFASDYLHSVNPYRGSRPRITLSWNITIERLPGRAGEGWEKPADQPGPTPN